MKFMITDGTEISIFEIADAEAVIKAKEIILSGYLKGMLIKDVKVIHKNLNLNLGGFGEFKVVVTTTNDKVYSFQILPDPNTFIDRLVNTVTRNGIRDPEETMQKVNSISMLANAWDDAIIESDSHLSLIDETPLFDIMDKVDEISRKQFEDTDNEIGILIDECEKSMA